MPRPAPSARRTIPAWLRQGAAARALALLLALGVTHPGTAAAEGARLELACAPGPSCTAEGACQPEAGAAPPGEAPLRFTLAPLQTGPFGGGDWEVAVNGASPLPARALSHTGPFAWFAPDGGAEFTLVLTGPDGAVWVRRRQNGGPPEARVQFLSCTITG